MIKVLFLIDSLEIGGAEKSLVEITSRFTEVTPIFIQVYKGDQLSDHLKEKDIRVIALNLKEKYGIRKAVSKIKPLLNEINPDIIHSTLYRSDRISRKLKKIYDIPLINSFVSKSYHSDRYSNLSLDKKIKLRVIEWLDKMSAKEVDIFISNSEVIKKENARSLGVSEDKIKVIPRGRSSKLFENNPSKVHNLKTNLGLQNKKVLLNVGRLIESKGQKDLIIAFSRLCQNFPDSILLIAGEGPFRPVLEETISNLKLENRVFLMGMRNDIPELLQMSDFFVFPTYLEGMPGSLIEAMFSKTLIICSDIMENRECLPPSFNNFFKPGDIEKLTQLLSEKLDGNSILDKSIEENYEYAVQNYEIDIVVGKYQKIYKELLSTSYR